MDFFFPPCCIQQPTHGVLKASIAPGVPRFASLLVTKKEIIPVLPSIPSNFLVLFLTLSAWTVMRTAASIDQAFPRPVPAFSPLTDTFPAHTVAQRCLRQPITLAVFHHLLTPVCFLRTILHAESSFGSVCFVQNYSTKVSLFLLIFVLPIYHTLTQFSVKFAEMG